MAGGKDWSVVGGRERRDGGEEHGERRWAWEGGKLRVTAIH
jgi:hypothetical protein